MPFCSVVIVIMMVPITKRGWLLLLQSATTLFSGVSARCNNCKASDELLVLLRSEDVNSEALPFCSSVLGLPLSIVEVTATEEVVITVTVATTVTQVVSDISSVTVTVSAPVVPTSSAAPVVIETKRRRDIASYPPWLPSGPDAYPVTRISSACHCLDKSSSIPLSTTTITHVDPDYAISVTVPATSTVISTLLSTVTATATKTLAPPASPEPSVKTLRVMIQALRKSTGAAVGWLYESSGPAITTDPTIAALYTVSVPEFGPEGGSGARIQVNGGDASKALGFSNPSSARLENYYAGVSHVGLTTPHAPYVCDGSNCWASDIWALNTETKAMTWNWVVPGGDVAPIALYRIGGRMYAVGNLAAFNTATGGSSSSKYEILLRYVEL